MATITTRAGKGSPLTNNEVDANFTNLNTDKAELSGATFTGEITANGGIALGDNGKATFGAGDDLQIYHDGSHSYIKGLGTGNLRVDAASFQIRSDVGENMAGFAKDGSVDLSYNGVTKFSTTDTGIDVTGDTDTSGLFRFGVNNSEIANNYVRFKPTGAAYIDHSTVGQVINFRLSASSSLDTTPLVVNSTGIDVTGTITADGLDLGDNVKAKFGAGGDLEIYHDGANSFINDTGTGNLYIQASDNIYFQSADGSHRYAQFINGGASLLKFDNTTRISTTSTGIDVTGTATMDGLTVDGNAVVNTGAGALSIDSFGGGSVQVSSNGAYKHISTLSSGYHLFEVNSKSVAKFNNNGDIRFYEDTGTTPKFFWDASAESLGIGTSTPAVALDVNGGSNTQLRLTAADSTGASIVNFGDQANAAVGRIIYSHINDSFSFKTNNVNNRMVIDASGNVGIGTDAPSSTLDVVSSSTNSQNLAEFSSASGLRAKIASDGGDDGYLYLYDSSDANTVSLRTDGNASFINGGGNVGIGTSSPSHKLSVSGSNSAARFSDDGTGYSLDIEHDTTNGITTLEQTNSGGDLRLKAGAASGLLMFEASGSERMRIDSSGNVGIGTSSPDQSIHIVSTTPAITLEDANGDSFQMSNNNGKWRVRNNTDSRDDLVVTGSGDVGIGTNSPSQAMHIKSTTSNPTGIGLQNSQRYYSVRSNNYSLVFSDETVSAERMRIDSSGNLLVGKSSTGIGTAGHQIQPNGTAQHVADGSVSLQLNRLTSDGDLAIFQKGGTTVGSIGTQLSSTYIGTGDVGLLFWNSQDAITPYDTGNTVSNGTIDLGVPNYKFKDLYLSGVAHVGGIETTTAGTSNFVAGVNAGNSIIAGGNYNTVVGDEAGTAITTGDNNTAIGFRAGDAITTAVENTGAGVDALGGVTTGNSNSAVGMKAGQSITTGANNAVLGAYALSTLTTASYNTAMGRDALRYTTTGSNNTSFGGLALKANTTASNNTAVGYNTLAANTTGTSNVAIGALALDANTTADNNTAVGYASLGANTTGANNVAVGCETLLSNTTGALNTAVGSTALDANTTGGSNTAIGQAALGANTTADNNTAVGYSSLGANTTGTDNTAVGLYALLGNTTGLGNSAVGRSALGANTTGSGNAAFGAYYIGNVTAAMSQNTTGASNSAFGAGALAANTTASNNTAVGYNSLGGNTTGTDLAAVGRNALSASTTGVANTALGAEAGYNTTTGGYNTFLGKSSHADAAGNSNCVVIGYNVSGASDYTTIGDGANDIRAAHGVATWATVSDERYKKDITDSTAGLSFINALKPRTWNYRTLGELPETFSAYEEGSTEVFKNTQTNHGFIAQEVKVAIDADSGLKDGFRLWDDREDGSQEVAEAALIPILVKAIQELTARLETLEG